MAVSYRDKYWLSQSSAFQHKVQASLMAACIAIQAEADTVAFHGERERYIAGILSSSAAFSDAVARHSIGAATDTNVINDATVNGTVALTDTATADTGAALVTDAHIDTAISGQFNDFFRTPGV